VAPTGMVPSAGFNNKPSVAAFIGLMPEVNHGGVVKAGLEWILALMPCTMLVASGLLYFLFIVATRGWVALVALAVVLPPTPKASSGAAIDRRCFSMALRPQGRNLSGRHWMLPIELHECALGQILQPLYLGIRWELLS
jgi:small-conductance mechanosensitive channel